MSTPLLNTKPLETFDPRQYQVPEQPAPPGYIKTLEEQAKRHEEEYGQALADWRKTYDDTVAEKANLYKADPKYAEAKRKEAAIKTLVGAFGSLADTFAVAFGGTAPLRDHRADIYRTQQQADALDQNERAKEASAYQKYLDRLEKLADKRPKWAKNDAAIQLARIYADENKWTLNTAFQQKLQGERLKAQAEEGEKNRKAAAARTQAQIEAAEEKKKGNTPRESDIRRIPLSGGRQLVLPKSIWHSGSFEMWITDMYKDERFDKDSRAKIRKALNQIGEMDKQQEQQSELGSLLAQYPDLERIITPYGEVVGGAKLTDPQGNTAKKVFE